MLAEKKNETCALNNQNEGLLSSQPIDCDRLSFKSTRGCQEFQGQETEDVATGGEATIHVCEGVCTWVYVLHECMYMCKHVCVHECIVSVHACVCKCECAWMHTHALSVWAHVYTCAQMSACKHTCMCVHVHVCTSMSVCMHLCMSMCKCVCMCDYMCQCMCTCVHECMCAQVCMRMCVVLSLWNLFNVFCVCLFFFFLTLCLCFNFLLGLSASQAKQALKTCPLKICAWRHVLQAPF